MAIPEQLRCQMLAVEVAYRGSRADVSQDRDMPVRRDGEWSAKVEHPRGHFTLSVEVNPDHASRAKPPSLRVFVNLTLRREFAIPEDAEAWIRQHLP